MPLTERSHRYKRSLSLRKIARKEGVDSSYVSRMVNLLNRYQRLRETGRNLNYRLVKQLPKTALSECGKKLGILKGKTLVFGDEDELSVLFDYCLYNLPSQWQERD